MAMRILSLLLALAACPQTGPLPDRLVRDPLPVIDGAHLDLPKATALRLIRVEGLNTSQIRLDGQMIVVGTGFGETPGRVLLGGIVCQVDVWRHDRISAPVPRLETGLHELVVETPRGERVVGLVVVFDATGGLEVPLDIREVDTAAPIVRLALRDRVEAGVQDVRAAATDNVGVVAVNWLVDGRPAGVGAVLRLDASSWAPGSRHIIEARAEDATGNIGLDRKEVLAEATQPPTISLAAGASREGHTAITIVSNDNVGVSQIDLFINHQPFSYPQTVPTLFDWNTSDPDRYPDGSTHTLTARALDAIGLSAQSNVLTQIIRNTGSPTLLGLETRPDPPVASGPGYPVRCVGWAEDPDQDPDGLRYDWEVTNEAGALVQSYKLGPRQLDVAMSQPGRYRVWLKRVTDRGGRTQEGNFNALITVPQGNGRLEGGT